MAYDSKDKLQAQNKSYYQRNRNTIAAKSRDNYHKHPEVWKNRRLKTQYGITLEQFNQMFISQNGACAICNNSFEDDMDTHVDHNHRTGQVRQLLCKRCNSGIGHFRENITLFDKAKEYLLKWSN